MNDAIDWTPITMKLSALQPWERNPKTITKGHAQRLLRNWKALGQWQTLAIGPNGEVYDGHQRLSTLLAAYGGDYEVKALQSSRPLTEKERGQIVFEGTAGAVGQIDWDVAAGFDADALKDWGMDTETLADWKRNTAALDNFLKSEQAEPVDAEPQVDRAAELNEKWQVKTGDLWQIGEHRLLCGDSTSDSDLSFVMGGVLADMIFEDPPYNVAGNGRNYAADAPTQKKTYEVLANSEWDKDFEIGPHLNAVLGIMSDDCAVYVCTSQWLVQEIWEWMWSWSKFCSYCIWCKPNPAPSLAKRHWNFATEIIPYAVRGKHTANYPSSGHALSWWEIVSPSHTEPHPTQKPIEIPSRAIEFSSHEEAVVFDGFAGSGTTLVACQNLSRKCRAIEISPAYCAVILERMATAFPGIEIKRLEPGA